MPKFLVIADDVTGGNATGALFVKSGFKSYCTIGKPLCDPCADDCNALIHVTCSRQMQSVDAYKRVVDAMQVLMDDSILLYSKRIDSTFRGNIATETEAMLDCLGDDYIAVVVAVFPSAGRIVRDGNLIVNGLPLDESSAAVDPLSPVKSSRLKEYFHGTLKYQTVEFTRNDYSLGLPIIIDLVKTVTKKGVRILIFDGNSEEDLEFISRLIITSKIRFISVDPGPFTVKCAELIFEEGNDHNTLVMIGSVYPQVADQVRQLQENTDSFISFINIKELIQEKEKRAVEIDRVVGEILDCQEKRFAFVVVCNSVFPENKLDLELFAEKQETTKIELAFSISNAFGEIAQKIMSVDLRFDTLLTCGGDITNSVCTFLGSKALKIIDEIAPLVVLSEFVEGSYSGIRLITKGGSIGDRNSLINAINYSRVWKRGK